MPLVTEMVHPKGFDFNTQKRIVLLREVQKLEWAEIASQVRDLAGKRPKPRQCAVYYRRFSRKLGRRRSNYRKCGPQKPFKATRECRKFLLTHLLQIRRKTVCTATTLQLELARAKKVKLTARYIRKLLQQEGYRWLPKRQKRIYSKRQRQARVKFCNAALRLPKKEFEEKFSFSMDGTIVPMPPNDPTERLNYCKHGVECMWRKPSEAFKAELSGHDDYHTQIPLANAETAAISKSKFTKGPSIRWGAIKLACERLV